MTPWVTAVLPVFNGADTVERAVCSLVAQTWPDLDIIAIDDGSSDGSWALLQRLSAAHGDRLQVLQSSCNIGLARTLNRANSLARGTWLMRSDQDDVSAPERARRLVEAAAADPEVGLVASLVDAELVGDAQDWAAHGLHAYEERRRRLSGTPFALTQELLVQGNLFHHGEVMYRKEVWQAAGGYRPQFCMSEDYDLWLRMAGLTKALILDEALYTRRICRGNSSHRFEQLQQQTARLAIAAAQRRAEQLEDEQWSRAELLSQQTEGPVLTMLQRHLEALPASEGA